MCLAIPGKVRSIWERDGKRMATVEFGNEMKEACLSLVPETEVGDYTIVHLGFALQRIDEDTALRTLALFQEMGEIEAAFTDPTAAAAEASGWAEKQAGWEKTP
jgi:hydrogenase expression/formation protein HypC